MNTNPKTGREGEEGGEQRKQNNKADWAKAPGHALENLSQTQQQLPQFGLNLAHWLQLALYKKPCQKYLMSDWQASTAKEDTLPLKAWIQLSLIPKKYARHSKNTETKW